LARWTEGSARADPHRQGSVLIVMLAGGEKSTQVRDIKRAQRILAQLELEP
jgi:putative component of toxin-antitoxin plasmid stabilization module